MPHGGVFELHQVLEDGVAENAAGVLSLAVRKWGAGLVEVHSDEGGITSVAALLSDLTGGREELQN